SSFWARFWSSQRVAASDALEPAAEAWGRPAEGAPAAGPRVGGAGRDAGLEPAQQPEPRPRPAVPSPPSSSLAADLGAAALRLSPTAAAFALPHWLAKAAPFGLAGAVLAATWLGVSGIRRLVDRLAERGHWNASTVVLARFGITLGGWLIGGIGAVLVAGGDPLTVLKGLGITTLGMSLAFKDFIGNLLQASYLMLSHPFDLGDHIRVEKKDYRVLDMTLRELVLTEDDGKSTTHYRFTKIAGSPIIVFKPYLPARGFVELRLPRPRMPSLSAWRIAGLAATGLGLAAAVPGLFFVQPWLLKTAPYLYAALVAGVTFLAGRWVPRIVDRFAKSRGWHPNSIILARSASALGAFSIGASAFLRAIGVSWTMLFGSLGLGALVMTIAVSDTLGSLVDALAVLQSKTFLPGVPRIGVLQVL
ncbi:MAG: mechanosensitive ion channel, partial [Elusimicrobia bacterium]|nr:mechanosensitive ion channel [Elusimicrobiota bacterium]